MGSGGHGRGGRRAVRERRIMSITEYNGGSVLAMVGKNCVGIASDTRFGIRHQTVATDCPKAFAITEKTWVGMPGLSTDVQTVLSTIKFKVKLFELREDRVIEPKILGNMISNLLYQKRFGPYFVEPVVAGLTKDNEPFISAMDLIGAPVFAKDFVVSGTGSEALYGMCETLYADDLEPEDLFETMSQCMLAACNRDALGGWGAVVTIITPDGVTTRRLKGRQD